jgi:hypothetical protein
VLLETLPGFALLVLPIIFRTVMTVVNAPAIPPTGEPGGRLRPRGSAIGRTIDVGTASRRVHVRCLSE